MYKLFLFDKNMNFEKLTGFTMGSLWGRYGVATGSLWSRYGVAMGYRFGNGRGAFRHSLPCLA